LRTNRKYDFEPYWQDEKDWLCIVEFLPTDNPEARLFAADIIGYLVLESFCSYTHGSHNLSELGPSPTPPHHDRLGYGIS
jgi:hypothetical protein